MVGWGFDKLKGLLRRTESVFSKGGSAADMACRSIRRSWVLCKGERAWHLDSSNQGIMELLLRDRAYMGERVRVVRGWRERAVVLMVNRRGKTAIF